MDVKVIGGAARCAYCDGFLGAGAPERNAIWNSTLLETKSFVVIPTLGMIVPGWLLIIPRQHYMNMGDLPLSLYDELDAVKRRAVAQVARVFDAPIIFEHGPDSPSNGAGSCIAHAHWHVVPSAHYMLSELASRFECQQIRKLHDLREFRRLQGAYLYYEDEKEHRVVCAAPSVPSQLLRRVVAKRTGAKDRWDWGVFPNIPNIQETLTRWRCIVEAGEDMRTRAKLEVGQTERIQT